MNRTLRGLLGFFPSSFILSQATLKKYQSERRSKTESIERCQSQLKKLRRKSQATRHPNKYGDREMQVRRKPKGVNVLLYFLALYSMHTHGLTPTAVEIRQ